MGGITNARKAVDGGGIYGTLIMMRTHGFHRAGFTLVEIMVVVTIIALLAAIAIPNLMRAKMSSNDALAKATLKAVSTSSESYAIANNNNYPIDETSLIAATPPYQNKSYCGKTISGYVFACTFGAATYTLIATPASVGNSGTTTFTITTGGILTP